MGLDARIHDAGADADGDWVQNIAEYRAGTNARDFWSVPLLSLEFPYVFSAPHFVLYINSIAMMVGGAGLGALWKKRRLRLLMGQIGAPDVETARSMAKGGFTSYELYRKAQAMGISSEVEYDFVRGSIEEENKENCRFP